MWIKDFFVFIWSIFVISLPTAVCTGWKPIAPPAEYYATQSTTTFKYPIIEGSEVTQSETQLKSTLLNQPIAFNQDKEYHQSNKKLDYQVFFPQDQGKSLHFPVAYQEALRKSPTSFFSFKTFGNAHKPSKTIYYGDLEYVKPKLTNDVKYYKPYKQNLGNDVKIFKPAIFNENEMGSLRPSKGNLFDEHCSLYKVSFRQDPYYQYIQYKVHMPEIKEFTLCLWARFHNHSHDHSLFSYSVKQPRKGIYMWASNLNEPGFFSMKIMGQTIFRLNFPIKLYKWYHTCQSWNGKTGEWQVWVNSHRIARGFHNLLVGHPIPGGGVAISGQQNKNFGKGYQEIPTFLKGTGGLEGEITMLQMYKVALTAGKAYNDHSHHHSHYTTTTTEPPELPSEEPSTTTDHPFLENGQLKPHINVIELAEALKTGKIETPDSHQHHHEQPSYETEHVAPLDYFHKPLAHYASPVSTLPLHGNTVNFVGFPNHVIFKRNDDSQSTEIVGSQSSEEQNDPQERVKHLSSRQVQVEKIKFGEKESMVEEETQNPVTLPISVGNTTAEESVESLTEFYEEENQSMEKDTGSRVGKRLRRHNPQATIRVIASRPRRILPMEVKPVRYMFYQTNKRGDVRKTIFNKEEPEAMKRYTFYEDPYNNFGTLGLIGHDVPSFGGNVQHSGYSFDHFSNLAQDYPESDAEDNQSLESPLDLPKKNEVELAEGEVRRIMELCSGCHLDPFRKVSVISWRYTPKKIFSGALFLKAKTECENF